LGDLAGSKAALLLELRRKLGELPRRLHRQGVERADRGLVEHRRLPADLELVFKGAKDEERFKSWTRERQVPTQLWYTAYPNRSVQNVLADNLLRRALASQSDAEIAAFLEML
jgi:hypothetical protein